MKTNCYFIKLLLSQLFFALLFVFSNDTIAQTSFKKKYTGNGSFNDANKIIETNDGGFFIAGSTNGISGGGLDILLIKLDVYGDTLWTKIIGGAASENPTDAEQTFDNGYIIAGRTASYGAGNDDVFLIKLDTAGNISWAKTYGDVGKDAGLAVIQTPDSGYIVTGYFEYPASTNVDGCVLKVDNTGEVIWAKIIGDSFHEELFSVLKTSNNNYLISGGQQISTTSSHLVILCINDAGDTLWTQLYDLAGFSFMTNSIEISNNSFLITGSTTQSPSFYNDFCAFNIDSLGNELWTKIYNLQNDDFSISVNKTTAGNFILSGFTAAAQTHVYDMAYLIMDPAGSVLNTRFIPNPNFEITNSSTFTTNANLAIVGTELDFSSGNQSIIFHKTDSLLNPACSYMDTIISPVNISPVELNTMFSISNGLNDSAFTPNVANIFSYSTICPATINVNDVTDNQFSVYPNPFDDSFDIIFPSAGNREIIVYDVTGKELISAKSELLNTRISLQSFASGVYFLAIKSGNDSFNRKLIKR